MDKTINFKDLSKKFGALNNNTKLSILSLLAEEGTKSVTDVSKNLKINFSTAHKYLEQLEKAGLVKSRQETRNRLKRMFTIQDFSINLSPKRIVSGEEHKRKEGFRIVVGDSSTEVFNERKFVKHYLEQGLPQHTVNAGIKFLRRNSYDGITSLELRHLFSEFLKQKINLLNHAVSSLEKKNLHNRTFRNILNMLHPEALTQHMNGDIFISNLGRPILRNCVFDIRGLAVHGITGNKPKDFNALLNDVLQLIYSSKPDTLPRYTLSDFNYFIAPLAKVSNHIDVVNALTDFLKELSSKKCDVYLELDLGDVPRYLKNLSTVYLVPIGKVQSVTYTPYFEIAEKLAKIIVEIIKQENITNVLPVFKVWKKPNQNFNFDGLHNFYLANMIVCKNETNVSFVGRLNRFDSLWKGWFGTNRVGEMQNITLNLPRLALNSRSTEEFLKKLGDLTREAVEYQLNMAELATADFICNHNISRDSAQRVRWDYVRVVNALYSISVIGLNETVFLLSGKSIKDNPILGELILKHCNSVIKSLSGNVRLALKEEFNPLIAERFYYLDSCNRDINIKEYSIGTGCRDPKIEALMQKYLPGGHCCTVAGNKFNIKTALEYEVSLIRVN